MRERSFVTAVILSVLGAGVASYLTWVHYNMDVLVCGTGDCEIVQTSVYATMMGVPIAAFGLAMYLTELALGVLRLRHEGLEVPLTMGLLALTLAGTLFSGWLTWLQLGRIEAICQWCLASAAVTALLFVNEVFNVRRLWMQDEHRDLESDALSRA